MSEQRLDAGATSGIVRVGDTVRRPMTESSPTIHALLIHLERQGFAGSPRFLGIDDSGRDILSFIPGDAGHPGSHAHDWSDAALVDAVSLLRDYHHAIGSFVPPSHATWRSTPEKRYPVETICHNDFAPYNCIFRNGRPVGMIDFDFACPGSKRWDLAHTVFRFAPLSMPEDRPALLTEADVERRLALACDAYGLEERSGFVEVIEYRVSRLKRFARDAAAGNDKNARRVRTERHIQRYERDLTFIRTMRRPLKRTIGDT